MEENEILFDKLHELSKKAYKSAIVLGRTEKEATWLETLIDGDNMCMDFDDEVDTEWLVEYANVILKDLDCKVIVENWFVDRVAFIDAVLVDLD